MKFETGKLYICNNLNYFFQLYPSRSIACGYTAEGSRSAGLAAHWAGQLGCHITFCQADRPFVILDTAKNGTRAEILIGTRWGWVIADRSWSDEYAGFTELAAE